MDKIKGQQILDLALKVTDAVQALHDAGCVGEDEEECTINFCGLSPFEMHVYSGLNELAELCGSPCVTKPRNCSKYPFEISFVHQGITFFQLDKDEESSWR
jgi:hypothetical protein